MVEVNKCNTPIDALELDKQSKEFQEKFWNYFYNVPYIKELTKPNRKYARDCPRDPRYKDGLSKARAYNPPAMLSRLGNCQYGFSGRCTIHIFSSVFRCVRLSRCDRIANI